MKLAIFNSRCDPHWLVRDTDNKTKYSPPIATFATRDDAEDYVAAKMKNTRQTVEVCQQCGGTGIIRKAEGGK